MLVCALCPSLQVMKSRDAIAAALKAYANLPNTKLLVKHYFHHAMIQHQKSLPEASEQQQQSRPQAGGRVSNVSSAAGMAAKGSPGAGGQSTAGKKMSNVAQMKGAVQAFAVNTSQYVRLALLYDCSNVHLFVDADMSAVATAAFPPPRRCSHPPKISSLSPSSPSRPPPLPRLSTRWTTPWTWPA